MARCALLGDGIPGGTVVSTAVTGGRSGIPVDVVSIGGGAGLVIDAGRAHVGDASLHVTTGEAGTNVYAGYNTSYQPASGAAQTATLWLYFAALPAAAVSVLWVGDSAARRICELRVNTAGLLRGLDATGTVVVSGSTAIPVGQWFRVDAEFTPSETAGTLRATLYADPSNPTPTEVTTQGTALNLRTDQVGLVYFGVTNAAPNADYWLQAVIADDGPAPFGRGVGLSRWVGAATASTVQVAARVVAAERVRLVVSTAPDLSAAPRYSAAVVPNGDGVAAVRATGLQPDTEYHYGLQVDGVVDPAMRGRFRTLPLPGMRSFSFAAASCARNNSNAAVFDQIRTRTGPDGRRALFFTHLGDLHYRDIAVDDQAAVRRAYDQVLAAPRQNTFFGDLPVVYTWSDHDSTGPNGDGSAASLPAVQAVYRGRVPHYPLPDTAGIYHSFTVGRVKFIVTDGRSYASAIDMPDGPAKTKLGAAQKAWLLRELADPAYPVVVWFHEDAWSNGATFPGDDTWSAYNAERQEIADYINVHDVKVAYVCGDLHVLAADDGTNSPGGIPVHVCSPMDQTAYVGNGVYSAGHYPPADSTAPDYYQGFGWFDVADTGDHITLTFTGYDGDGVARVTQTTRWSVEDPRPGRDVVVVPLAHHVDAWEAAELGAVDVRDYQAGDHIAVPRDQVMRLVNAGRVAGVDPDDEAAVRALLGLPALAAGPGRPVGALFQVRQPGPVTVGPGTVRYYNDTGRRLQLRTVRASVGVPPAGSGIRVNVRRNGVPVFGSVAAQPAIPAGGLTAAQDTPPEVVVEPGDYLTVDVDTVGAETPGSDLLVTVAASDISAFIGAPGRTPQLVSGDGPPSELAADGDLYLDTGAQTGGDLYQQQGGAWLLVGNLRGPAGDGAAITINGITGTEFMLDAASVGAETPAGAQAKASAAQQNAVAASVPRDSTAVDLPAGPLIRHHRAFEVDAASPDVLQVYTQGTLTGWLNEWGGYRGRPAFAWDAVVRMIAHAAQSGNIIEYQNTDRSQTLWGIDPDGYQVQGNGQAPPVVLAPLMVLPTGAPVPDGTPPGTIIVRR